MLKTATSQQKSASPGAAAPLWMARRQTQPLQPSHSLLHLQQTIGNQAVGQLIQTKQQGEPASDRGDWKANRAEAPEVPPSVHEALRSPGQPLDSNTRALMESRFGHDFSQVRVHTDAKAAESAQAVNALAYTAKQDIVFGSGQYAPEKIEGRQLLAHELTHVVQQHRAAFNAARPLLSSRNDSYERAANSNAVSVGSGTGPVPLIQRQKQREQFGPAAGAPSDWDDRVNAAKTSSDRAALIHEAVGLEVIDRTNESRSDKKLEPAHLIPFTFGQPRINYDDNLEQKAGKELAGRTKRSGKNYYVVLGPKALKADNFFWTRIILNHEFDHIRQFEAGSPLQGNESEVDAWTSTFIREFHRSYVLDMKNSVCRVQSVPEFKPLLFYYMKPKPDVSDNARDNSVQRIVDYYNSTLRSHPAHSRVFRFWVHRTLSREPALAALAQRLNADLQLGIDPEANLTTTRQFDCAGVRQATFPSPPSVELPSAGGSATPRRFGLELKGGVSLSEGQRSAAFSLGTRFSLRSDRVIIFNPSIGASLLYLPPTGDRTTHLAAAIAEISGRVQQPLRGFYLDVRAGGYIGLELPTPELSVEGGFTGAIGSGYRWERLELGVEARGLLGIDRPDRFFVLGVGSINF